MKLLLPVILVVVLGACTIKAEIPSEARPRLYSCTDLRDNEKFNFWGSDVYNARVDYGFTYKVTCFEVRDTLGQHRTICTHSGYPDHFKCIRSGE